MQHFERHPALASWIARLAISQSDLSLGEWMVFLGSLNEALDAARAECVAAEDKDLPSILERGARGERLTTVEQSAWAGYEFGWRDGHRTQSAAELAWLSHHHKRHPWAQPGDEPNRIWIMRFADPDIGEMVWTDECAEADAKAAYEKYSPAWNVYLLATVPTSPPSRPVAISQDEVDAVRQFADALQTWADGCVEARQWGGPTMYPEHPVSEQRARTEAHALKALLAKLGSPANSSGSLTSSDHVRDVGKMVTGEMVNAAWNAGKDRRMSGLPSDFREVLIAALLPPEGDGK